LTNKNPCGEFLICPFRRNGLADTEKGKKPLSIFLGGSEMVRLTIDGKEVSAPEKSTILEAARSVGIKIPTLCFHEKLKPIGSCRMCVVEVEGYMEPMTPKSLRASVSPPIPNPCTKCVRKP
jgi:ferredoxin